VKQVVEVWASGVAPEEAGSVVKVLLSDEPSYMTGTLVPVPCCYS
jgi:hypothetical protein